MTSRLLVLAFLCGTGSLAHTQTAPRPDVPTAIQVPADEQVVLQAHATGSQIYTCQQGSDGKWSWTLKAPEAELRDQSGALIGRHFAGPTWSDADGSVVPGEAVAHVTSPDAGSIPWLLLGATSHSGKGVLSRVAHIQRIHTHGGQPPAASDCDASKHGSEIKSSYTADYYFYGPLK